MTFDEIVARIQLYILAAQMAAGVIAGQKKPLPVNIEAEVDDPETANGQMWQLTHHFAAHLGEQLGDPKAVNPMAKVMKQAKPSRAGAPAQAQAQAPAQSQRFSEADIAYLREQFGGDKPRMAPTNPPPGQRGRAPLPVTEDQGEDGENDE